LTVLVIAGVWTLIVPKYQARGEVQVRPVIRPLVFKTDETGPIPFYEQFLNTQVAVMRSPTVLSRVLDQTDVRETKWYREPKQSLWQRVTGQAASPVERLRDALSVRPRRRTEIIDVSFSCASAGDAVVIANAVLDQHMNYVEETLSGQRTEEDHRRDELYQRLKSEIANQMLAIDELVRVLGTLAPQELITAKRLRLDERQDRLDELQQNIERLELQVNQIADGNKTAVGAAGPTGASMPLKQQLALARQERKSLEAKLKKDKAAFEQLLEKAQKLEILNAQMQDKRALFDAVREIRVQRDIERGGVARAISVLTRAFVPSKPHKDRRILYTGIALLVCLISISCVVFLHRVPAGKSR
jgi:uncharacterized protein involved in exopolysaccharide biosynthesis